MNRAAVPHVPIGDVVVKASTWNPARDAADSEIAYIDLSAIDNVTKTISGFQSMAGRDAPSRARQLVQGGDLLVSTVRPNLNGVARVPNHLDGGTASTGFCVLRPNADKIDASFLFHWIQSPNFIDDMIKKATGASYPAVSDRIILQSEMPLPPLDEQKRIAAILDQADALRRKRQRALDRLNQLGQAIFHEMFGDPAQNDKRFRAAPLTQAFDFKTGKLDSNAAIIGGQYPFFTCAKEIFSIDKFAFDCEALLLAGNNASATYDVKYYKGKFNAYQRTYVIQVNEKFEISYLYAKIALENSLQDLKRFSKGSNTKYITMEILGRMEILIPPISLQRKFETLYREVLERNIALGNALAANTSLFETLQHRAFKGEL